MALKTVEKPACNFQLHNNIELIILGKIARKFVTYSSATRHEKNSTDRLRFTNTDRRIFQLTLRAEGTWMLTPPPAAITRLTILVTTLIDVAQGNQQIEKPKVPKRT